MIPADVTQWHTLAITYSAGILTGRINGAEVVSAPTSRPTWTAVGNKGFGFPGRFPRSLVAAPQQTVSFKRVINIGRVLTVEELIEAEAWVANSV